MMVKSIDVYIVYLFHHDISQNFFPPDADIAYIYNV